MNALFAGSFDPFTIAHLDIAQRGLKLFDHLFIGIGENYTKKALFDTEERIRRIEALHLGERVSVLSYRGTTADCAKQVGAHVLLRGARTTADFEQEKAIADANRTLFGLDTVVLFTKPELSFVSSTLARDLLSHGKDVSHLLP